MEMKDKKQGNTARQKRGNVTINQYLKAREAMSEERRKKENERRKKIKDSNDQ